MPTSILTTSPHIRIFLRLSLRVQSWLRSNVFHAHSERGILLVIAMFTPSRPPVDPRPLQLDHAPLTYPFIVGAVRFIYIDKVSIHAMGWDGYSAGQYMSLSHDSVCRSFIDTHHSMADAKLNRVDADASTEEWNIDALLSTLITKTQIFFLSAHQSSLSTASAR
jgi:hypothetical protein